MQNHTCRSVPVSLFFSVLQFCLLFFSSVYVGTSLVSVVTVFCLSVLLSVLSYCLSIISVSVLHSVLCLVFSLAPSCCLSVIACHFDRFHSSDLHLLSLVSRRSFFRTFFFFMFNGVIKDRQTLNSSVCVC